MSTRADAIRALRTIGAGPDNGFDIAAAALHLAALERPQVALDRYRAHLETLAREVADAAAGERSLDAGRCAEVLAGVMLGRHGYRGDDLTYDDLQNGNLMRVIDRRKGLPVTLGILYMHAARAQGWHIVGLAFPCHFLLRLEYAGERVILDPFHEGCQRDSAALRELLKTTAGADAELAPGHYAPVSDKAILLRLQNNLKLRFLHMRQPRRAAAIVDTMLLFAPDRAELWREAGLLHARSGDAAASIAALEEYLRREKRASARHEAATLLQRLRRGSP